VECSVQTSGTSWLTDNGVDAVDGSGRGSGDPHDDVVSDFTWLAAGEFDWLDNCEGLVSPANGSSAWGTLNGVL